MLDNGHRVVHLDVEVGHLQNAVVHLYQPLLVLGAPVLPRRQALVVLRIFVDLVDLRKVHRHEGGLQQVLHKEGPPVTDVAVALVGNCNAGDGQ